MAAGFSWCGADCFYAAIQNTRFVRALRARGADYRRALLLPWLGLAAANVGGCVRSE